MFSGMVALPHQDVQLQIFEARYRVLFHTLLAGGDGCEPGDFAYKVADHCHKLPAHLTQLVLPSGLLKT